MAMGDRVQLQSIRIGEMSKRVLIDEVIYHQEQSLQGMTINQLRGLVVRFRAEDVHKALIAEAGLDESQDDQGQGQFL